MKYFIKKLLIFLLVISILVPSLYIKNAYSIDEITGYETICDNQNLALYANMKTGDFIIKNKQDNYLWYSSPLNLNSDKKSNALYKSIMSSQITIEYVDSASKSYTANCYDSCIKKNGVKLEKLTNGFKVTYNFATEGFIIPVVYTIENDHLNAEIINKEIKENNEGYKLINIGFMPYFGAGSINDNGFVFVPDGSGAIIDFNNGKQNSEEYKQIVYGKDKIYNVSSEKYVTYDVKMPVFGTKNGNNSFIGVISSGEALATINSAVSGGKTNYNNVYAQFAYKGLDNITMREQMGNARDVKVISKEPSCNENFKIEYYFLNEAKSSYEGMAEAYRNYLIKNKDLKKSIDSNTDIPFYIDLYGAVDKKKSYFLIPMMILEPLTTYSDCINILDAVKKSGIDNIVLRYNAWMEGGLQSKMPSKVSFEKKLGGEEDFKKLIEYVNKNNIGFYPDVDFINFYKSSSGYAKYNSTAKTISGSPSLQFLFDIVTYYRDRNKTPWYLLSTTKIEDEVRGFMEDYRKLNINGISLSTLGNVIYSDYRNDEESRFYTQKIFTAAFKNINNDISNIMVDSGNDYSLPFAKHILNSPDSCSNFDIEDREIPFYQMVYHGYINYSSSAINIGGNAQDKVLKAIEYGESPMFSWIGKESSILEETSLEKLYSSYYKVWIEEASAEYKEINNVLSKVKDANIVRHEELMDNVYQVTYSNNLKIVVNYNNKDIKLNDLTIKAKGYMLIRG